MDPHDVAIRYIGTLGFPIFVALAIGLVLWKLANMLALSHVKFLGDTQLELQKQTATMERIEKAMPALCRVENCSNFEAARKR